MSFKLTDDTHYSDIADAIRAKSGDSGTLAPSEMAAAIDDLPSGGTNKLKSRITGFNIAAYHYSATLDDFVTAQEAYQASITELPHGAFFDDQNVVSIDVPAWVTGLNSGQFAGCRNLESLTFHGGLNSIRNASTSGLNANPIRNCPKLTELELPMKSNSTVSISSVPVYNCTSLRRLSLTGTPSQISFTYACLAESCTALEEVEVCDGLANFGGTYNYALNNCSGMKRLILHNTTVPTLPAAGIFSYQAGFVPGAFEGIYVVDSLVEDYKAATNWSGFASYILPISDLT